MNENIDLTKILRDCPEGWPFYSSTVGRVTFVKIDLDDPEYLDFIGTGGSVRLLRDLVTEMDPESLAIIVGQQPYLSLWSQELSGTFLRFKKGTAACFKLPNEGGEAKAELKWYLQTREFVKIDEK